MDLKLTDKQALISGSAREIPGFPGDGGKSQAAFKKAAEELFGGVRK